MKVAKERKVQFSDFLLHIHPRTVDADTMAFTRSFGLGGMALTLLALLFGSGLFQLLMYVPSADKAYVSIQLMYTDIPLGGWIRNIHFWSANLLVIVVVLHLLRVYLTGALADGRQLNWIIGLLLLTLVLAANFSGYLLPWDQLSYWAVTIFTGMFQYIPVVGPWLMELLRGGRDVGPATLSTFYALHIGVIPFCFIVFCLWHFWLVRKAGGLVRQHGTDQERDMKVSTVPHLIVREVAVSMWLLSLIFLFAAGVDAPLSEPANSSMSPNPAKAAWYFVGLQELLMHLHPVIVICVIPLIVLLLLVGLPFWKEAHLLPGKWAGGTGGLWKFSTGIGFGAGVILVMVLLDDMVLQGTAAIVGGADLWLRGFIPLLMYVLLIIGLYFLMKRNWNYSPATAVLVLAGILVGNIITLTLIGIWLRGPGMQLLIAI